jgi:hypothetical protein
MSTLDEITKEKQRVSEAPLYVRTAGRRSRRSRTGEWKMTVRGALRPAAVLRADWTSATAGSAAHRARAYAAVPVPVRHAQPGRHSHWQCSKGPLRLRQWLQRRRFHGHDHRGQFWRLRHGHGGRGCGPERDVEGVPMLLRHHAVRECVATRLETVGRACRARRIDGLHRYSTAGERAKRCRAGSSARPRRCRTHWAGSGRLVASRR